MKKHTLFATLFALLLGACTPNELDNIAPEVNNEITLPDLTAGFADDDATKTYVEESKYLRWHEADLITAFYGNTLNRQYKFKGKTGDNSGTFSLVPSGELGTGNALEAIYSIYPYDEDATITDKGEISLTLPATQYYAENSFGKGANTMIAVTESVEDTFLPFKNACGYLKLKLYNESGARLKSVEVRGNNSEKIAGSATATIEFGGVPTVVMGNDATTTVTLDCGEDGIALGTTSETATELWVVLPEVTFEGGITITATDTEGITFEKSTTKPVAITRNDIQPMKALKTKFVAPIPTNEIHYTATAKVTPYTRNFGGANIISNEWDEITGKGIITCDKSVTSIEYKAFYNCSSLTNITIPESVTSIGSYAFAYCSSLAKVYCKSTTPPIGSSDMFEKNASKRRIYVPSESINAYKTANYWSDYLPIIVAYDFDEDEAIIPTEPANNEIWYTATNEISPYQHNFGGAELDTKVWDSSTGEGIFIFDGEVTMIGESAFEENSELTSITIPDSVTEIGCYAFKNCSNITAIHIPESVTFIDTFVFFGCPKLTKIDSKLASEDGRCLIIDGVLYSFLHTGPADYNIPQGVTEIREGTFQGCTSLASITIPDSVTKIGDNQFLFCSSLASIYCKATIPPRTLYGTFSIHDFENSDRKIYVPSECVEAYKTNYYWERYANYIVGYNF